MRTGHLLALVLWVATVCATAPPPSIFSDCSPEADGHQPFNSSANVGPWGKPLRFNTTFLGSPLVVLYPAGTPPADGFPLLVFMHGSTAQYEMYQPNLEFYASQGFVVVFPYIKGPEADKLPITLNTNGKYIVQGLKWAAEAQTAANASSPLHGKVDMANVVVAGHSMGASCAIMAGHGKTDPDVARYATIKLVVTQHPGICGPVGPPPWPSTWMPDDLQQTVAVAPTLFTTSTNDGAFWPAPHTAEHELGCFAKSALGPLTNSTSDPAAHRSTFVQFSEDACQEDGNRLPFDDKGHDCPFKNGVETPWVTTAIKLYAQQGGMGSSRGQQSRCAAMLYGSDSDSLSRDRNVYQTQTRSYTAQ